MNLIEELLIVAVRRANEEITAAQKIKADCEMQLQRLQQQHEKETRSLTRQLREAMAAAEKQKPSPESAELVAFRKFQKLHKANFIETLDSLVECVQVLADRDTDKKYPTIHAGERPRSSEVDFLADKCRRHLIFLGAVAPLLDPPIDFKLNGNAGLLDLHRQAKTLHESLTIEPSPRR